MKRKIFGTLLIWVGAALILSALAVAGYYLWAQEQAGDRAERTLEVLIQQIPTESPSQTKPTSPAEPSLEQNSQTMTDTPEPGQDLDSKRSMPEIVIDGVGYIGYLDIPALGLSLPVLSQSSKENLDIAPCRFYGTAYQKNFVIGGHRYSRHFAKLNTLGYGERLVFTDVEGTAFTYEVVELEVIEAYEAEYLCSGDWDLSLYTCTVGGTSRVVLRCQMVT